MKKITALLLNYKRPDNIPQIIDCLKSQTIDCSIFLWNNSPNSIIDNRIDWQINSMKNANCWPRWFMASYAETEYVFSMDDDIIFNSNIALEILIHNFEEKGIEGRAFGIEGVQLAENSPYYPSQNERELAKNNPTIKITKHVKNPKEDVYVDIIKGRLLACRKEDLKKIPISSPFRRIGDDIATSFHLSNGKEKHHIVLHELSNISTDLWGHNLEMALCSQDNWFQKRDEVKKYYFG